jgi:thioredoxin-dependent peroxiredoxin
VIGISTDAHQTQCDFAKSLDVSFPMIGDSDRAISKAYGVSWPLLGVDRRVTFVIDAEGVVRGVFNHELQIGKHLEETRALLSKLHRPS